MERRRLRREFLAAFEEQGLDYRDGGWQVAHREVTWSISLVVDGSGPSSPYRLVLGLSLADMDDSHPPRPAEDCPLSLRLGYGGRTDSRSGPPSMPDATFPDWQGTDRERAAAIGECVAAVVRYAREVGSPDEVRARYSAGDYDGAFIHASMRQLLRGAL